ncbi:hypothetical protein GOBAR_AA01684 [Gossypium barbadense]|uniref:NAC domain-containing protein n=2 Tax=Gossypium barbadense TaxID=3634 RepID=A0A2P5YTG3_GOSBA|nr:hypothetical protein GOBAR_AA01684 [Gossypium barbadense]
MENSMLKRLKEEDDEEYFRMLPAGYRFKPTDQELMDYYLRRKISGLPLPPNKIREVNFYSHDPETLTAMNNKVSSNEVEKEWYYFTPRERKYTNGSRPARKGGNGYWKATGVDKQVLLNGKKIGSKKTLVFHEGKPPKGSKTNWIMHEYVSSHAPVRVRHGKEDMKLDNWVLCKLYQNSREAKQKHRTTQEGNGLECQEKVEADIAAIVPNKMAAAVSESINMVASPAYHQYEQLDVESFNMNFEQDTNRIPEQGYPMPLFGENSNYYMFDNNSTLGGGFQQQVPNFGDFVTNAAAAAPVTSMFPLGNQFQSMANAGFNLPPLPLQFRPQWSELRPPPQQFSGVNPDFDFSVDEYLLDYEFGMPPPPEFC